MKAVVLVMSLAAFPLVLSAQWPDYPTPGVAKTPEGKPKLDGPAPRTPDGHPDLSGVWENVRGNVATFAAEVLKRRMAENSKDNPDAHCLVLQD